MSVQDRIYTLADGAADRILADLTGRRGVGDELESLDDDLQAEIHDAISTIVEEAIRTALVEQVGI